MVCTVVKPRTCLCMATVLSEFRANSWGYCLGRYARESAGAFHLSSLYLLIMVFRTFSLSNVPR